MLEIKDLTMAFGGLIAFHDISFDIKKGQIIGLIGPNGAGKTTLINCISGVYQPIAGDITFKGQSLKKLRPHQICRLGIGRTYQIPRPFLNMTVINNLQVCSKSRHTEINWLLELTNLWNKRHQLAKTLTFQERRQLEFCRALSVEPDLLLLDETIAGLNPAEVEEMMVLLRYVHQKTGITILWIEHVMQAIMNNAHHIVVLHQGSLIARGTPQQIANDSKVIEAYLGEEYQFKKEAETNAAAS
ncbi:MAG: ABC transporter ATP-binding protein [Deltaproteobacteria bacterium]|nr:ABC transporter ATP-binding protein [Deltaproteobacteria bacterium]